MTDDEVKRWRDAIGAMVPLQFVVNDRVFVVLARNAEEADLMRAVVSGRHRRVK